MCHILLTTKICVKNNINKKEIVEEKCLIKKSKVLLTLFYCID